tara:strand:- start:47 stop:313 length:267 start_codon:yes stop_codon:yes gene_type:complete
MTVKDMDNAIVKIEDAIAEMAGLDRWSKRSKGQLIGAKIESLRLKCVLRQWMDQVDKLEEVMDTCMEVSLELDSARRKVGKVAKNTNY